MSAHTPSVLVQESDFPEISTDTDALSSAAARISKDATGFKDAGESIFTAWQPLPQVFSAPGVLDTMYRGMDPVHQYSADLGDSSSGIAAALNFLATETHELKLKITTGREDTVTLHADIAGAKLRHDELHSGQPSTTTKPAPYSWQDDPGFVERNADLVNKAKNLTQLWQTTKDNTISWLGGLSGGENSAIALPDISAISSPNGQSDLSVYALTGMTVQQLDQATPGQLFNLLKTLTPDELKDLLKKDPNLEQDFWNNPPDSKDIAQWWKNLPPETQNALEKAIPSVLGNLGGVPYTIRSAVNTDLYNWYKDHKSKLTQQQKSTLDQMENAYQAAGTTPTQLIDFNFGSKPPMVAISYGNLDTADTSTWMAPGMGFSADKATGDWGKSAKNLYDQQYALQPAPASHAVVAWLGYPSPDALGENSGDVALAGSHRFAAELDANHDTRQYGGGNPGVASPSAPTSISVVAHSYGTTLAADALTQTKYNVDSFTMDGSAGLDPNVVTSLKDLHINSINIPGQGEKEAVYTTAAAQDYLAPFGSNASGRLEPNPGAAYPTDPTIGGAQSFSSNGDAATGRTYVDGHNPIGKPGGSGINWLDANPSPGHGYFDSGTQSLYNTAATTLGMPDQVDGGLSDTTGGSQFHNFFSGNGPQKVEPTK